ncbi:MAG: DNA polymerase III subunit gamma/tau [Betaproteobacteria bacterium HGW-Betaproteobacteria-7]|jgi:DNA polymerase-3 subunit gamma/tau|nr:MAG: DNA polymerase III subunit gamma/tau [Betaproteobacteria bacterium HGW-Betaproteobacteria-7]
MSYQVLARKWRPRNFSTLVGQEHVVRALNHALSERRLHHAYLFTGTRGVGKTTIARILAKSLNCESGITATPCGTCSACVEIDGGRFVDLLEVDAATNTKVDEMRQLLENAVYAPTRGRFKVYVIDEVHMLSNSAFNAMLKTLEEPPEHVKFILATTDPQKIPVTVLSRCLQFNLKQMPASAITGHLANILQAESVSFDAGALALIARSAAGSMRDALSLLDQAIAHGAGKVEEEQVRSMLGTVDRDYLFAILDALAAGDASAMLAVAADLGMRSLSFSAALQELATLFTTLQIAQCVPSAIDDDDPGRDRLLALAAVFSPEFVQLGYQIAVVGRNELPAAPDEYSGFVMTLLRLHTFRPSTVADVVAAARPSPPRPPAVLPSSPAPQSVATPQRRAPPEPEVASAGAGNSEWSGIVATLNLSGLARTLAQHCELRHLDDLECLLRLAPAHSHLQMKPAPERLQQALSEHFGRPLRVRFELADNEVDTPAAAAGKDRQLRLEKAVAAIEQDGFVRDVIESFDASVVESSIKPIA